MSNPKALMASVNFAAVIISSAIFLVAPVGESAAHASVHEVRPGETLWRIARANGCDVEAVRKANRLTGNNIRPGQSLRIPSCTGTKRAITSAAPAAGNATPSAASTAAKRSRRVAKVLAPRMRGVKTHRVHSGDTLYQIAKKYKTSVSAIRSSNRLSGNLIRPGVLLRIPTTVGGRSNRFARRPLPRGEGQSFGWPSAGRLFEGTQLPAHDGYHRRRPDLAWGTSKMVTHLQKVVDDTFADFPELHRLSIGDISSPNGGRIKKHVSHQSGRDVDIGFYFRNVPEIVPRAFVVATKSNLHFEATWQLIETLLATRDLDGGLQMIFLSYELQELLYNYALRIGVPKDEVDELFQYPAAPHTARGIIRHEPGHENHLHARFGCPRADTGCR